MQGKVLALSDTAVGAQGHWSLRNHSAWGTETGKHRREGVPSFTMAPSAAVRTKSVTGLEIISRVWWLALRRD